MIRFGFVIVTWGWVGLVFGVAVGICASACSFECTFRLRVFGVGYAAC